MRFELTTDIAAPPATVWDAFSDPAKLPRWQPNLEEYEAISGEPGWPGAVSLLVYHEKGRRVEITGTVLERHEGQRFAGRYENAWSVNEMVCDFEPLPDGGTRWHATVEYHFKGWVALLSLVLRDGIRRRVLDDMQRFKELVESGELENTWQPPPSTGDRTTGQHRYDR